MPLLLIGLLACGLALWAMPAGMLGDLSASVDNTAVASVQQGPTTVSVMAQSVGTANVTLSWRDSAGQKTTTIAVTVTS
jgi:hypothetical protein